MSDNNQTYKADNGKTRLDLVSPTFIEAVGRIRTFGVQKYGDSDSWAKVEPQRYMAALLRHINAYRMGEGLDKESGMPHLWHAACNLMFLIDLDELKAVSFGEGDTPPKYTPNTKSCLNCVLFCECEDTETQGIVNGCCDKWRSVRVEETKATISVLPDRIPDDFEKSCSNCDYYGKCLRKSIRVCEDWQHKF